MKKIGSLISSFFHGIASWWRQDLIEFSTSMDFDEFEVVLKYLENSDRNLARVVRDVLDEFRASTPIGESDTWKLVGDPGYIELEREDDQAFGIAVFATKHVTSLIDSAYERGIEELGI